MSKQFVFVTPVWGSHHIKLFLEVGLPSLLTENNLPKLSQLSRVVYLLYIYQQDENEFRSSSVIKTLRKIVEVKIVVFENDFSNNHLAMSWCHKQGFNYAIEACAYAVFIPPDCIWSNQAMLAMYNIVEQGYKIIHMSGLRLVSELFLKTLKDHKSISFSPRELVKLALQYLHPITCSHFFDEKLGGLMPANLFWTVDKDGIIARCFHLHPLLAYGKSEGKDFQSTIDDDLALVFDSEANEEYIVTDSDELIAFEISSLSHKVLAAYRKGNISDIANWAEISTNSKHHSFIKKTIKIHSEDFEHAGWLHIEHITDEVVEKIFEALELKKSLSMRKILHRMRNNKWFNKVFNRYLSFMNIIMIIFNRMMRSSAGLYPWHWNFLFQRDVCNPFIEEIKTLKGNILYFDDKYHPLIHDINRLVLNRTDLNIDLKDINVINHCESFSRIYKDFYDVVIIRDFDCFFADSNFLNTLKSVLKTKGKIIYYSIQDIDIKAIGAHLPQEIIFLSEQTFGGKGTKILLDLYHRSQNRVILGHSYTLALTMKLLLVPVLLILYPVTSLMIGIANHCFAKNQNWAVKRFDFSRG